MEPLFLSFSLARHGVVSPVVCFHRAWKACRARLAHIVVTAGVLLTASAPSVWAVDPKPSPTPTATPPKRVTPAAGSEKKAEPVFDVDDVVVTGSLNTLPVWKTANSVEVVTPAQVKARKPLEGADTLITLPGVNVLRGGSLGSLTTVQIRGSASTDVLVLQDGRPLNEPSVGSADLSTLPADYIDHVEVVRGPYSALYGGNAMSGVVQFITKDGADHKSGADYVGGGQGTSIASGIVSAKLGKADLLIVPTLRSVTGDRPNASSELQNGFLRFSLPTGTNETLTISAGLNRSRVGTPGPQPAADVTQRTQSQLRLGNNLASTLVDSQGGSQRFLNIDYKTDRLLVHAWQSAWTPTFHNAYVDFAGDIHAADTVAREYDTGVDARIKIPHLKDSALTLGALYERTYMGYSSVDTDTTLAVSAAPVTFVAGRDIRAIYAEESLQLGRLSATLGLRAENGTGYGGQISPRTAFLYRLNDQLGLRAAWGRGFRAPTLSELYYPESFGAAGNPNLRPQTSTTYEIGLEALITKQLLLRLTGFSDDVNGLIAYAPVGPVGPFGNEFIPSNLNKARKKGVESQLQWQVTPELTVGGTYTYIDATQINQEVVNAFTNQLATVSRPLANVPRTRATVTVSWQQPKGFGVQIDGVVLGERGQYYANYSDPSGLVTYDTKALPAVGVLDLTVGHHARLGDVQGQVFLKITNLLNSRYALNFGNDFHDLNYPMPGRTFYFGLSPRF